MTISIGKIRQRFSFPGCGRLPFSRPFRLSIPFSLIKALHHKVAGRHGNGKGDLRIIGSCNQRKHSCGGRSGNSDLFHSSFLQIGNSRSNSLYRQIMMTVILMSRTQRQYADSEFLLKPLHRGSGHIILAVVSKHCNDGTGRSL